MPNKAELERYWKERWHKAKVQLEAARAHLSAMKDDASAGTGNAYRSALEQETAALIEYSRVLRIYTDLVVHGKSPEDKESATAGDE